MVNLNNGINWFGEIRSSRPKIEGVHTFKVKEVRYEEEKCQIHYVLQIINNEQLANRVVHQWIAINENTQLFFYHFGKTLGLKQPFKMIDFLHVQGMKGRGVFIQNERGYSKLQRCIDDWRDEQQTRF